MSTQAPKTSKCIYLHRSLLHFLSVKWEQCRPPQLTALFCDHHRKPTKRTIFSSEQPRIYS